MGYNISQWKTKRIENLVIPNPPIIAEIDGKRSLLLECGCGQEIKGYAGNESPIAAIHVTEFDMHGEGSGTFWHEVLKQALEKSTGLLEAVRVWEDGDYIDRLRVKDGVISKTEIKL